jgi:hypothetical protein
LIYIFLFKIKIKSKSIVLKKIRDCLKLDTPNGVLHILAAAQALKMVIRVIYPYQIETPIENILFKLHNEETLELDDDELRVWQDAWRIASKENKDTKDIFITQQTLYRHDTIGMVVFKTPHIIEELTARVCNR